MRPGVAALLLVALVAAATLHVLTGAGVPEEAHRSVILVVCDSGSFGTGWWVNDEGYLVTAYHVVDDCGGIQLLRTPWSSRAVVVAHDPHLDVAVLRSLDPPPGGAEPLPLSFDVKLGDEVYVVGYPVQLYLEVGEDMAAFSGAPRLLRASVAWLHPAAPYFTFQPATDAGNSGGPVVSARTGGVVGIVVYARPGVVATEFVGLRMDALAL